MNNNRTGLTAVFIISLSFLISYCLLS